MLVKDFVDTKYGVIQYVYGFMESLIYGLDYFLYVCKDSASVPHFLEQFDVTGQP